jgi:hypothetical protein
MHIKKLDSVMIWSENWKELAKWYKEKFDLGEGEELVIKRYWSIF